jgi:urea transport system permease protein
VLVNYAKTFFTGALPEVWLYALGSLFVLVTLFLPRGLMGLVSRLRPSLQAGDDLSSTWTDPSRVGVSAGSKAK